MPNANELERANQERALTSPMTQEEVEKLTAEQYLEFCKSKVYSTLSPKSTKEFYLAEIRKLEKKLGLPGRNYNGHG